MLRDLVLFIVKSLADDPDKVRVDEVEGERSLVFEISVSPDDMGRIIGRRGRVIAAVRSVVGAAAAKEGKRVNVVVRD